jgi:putative tryptophan/tyrosine transport system substrate-binding protein
VGLASTMVLPFVAYSQAAKVRVGYLSASSVGHPLAQRNVSAFRDELAALGYVEGQNIEMEYRYAENQIDRLPALAAELVRLGVAVIVAGPTPAAVAAKRATDAIPIVVVNVADPVGLGLVAGLARPGGNVTGVSFSVGLETFGKGLELLKAAVPDLRSVAVLANPANPSNALAVTFLEEVAKSLRVRLQRLEINDPGDFEGAFAAMTRERAGAVVIVPDTHTVVHAARLAELAVKHRLPTLHAYREEVEAGGLLSYGPSLVEVFRRAASYVDKILKGAKPADLPVEQPTRFELVINLKTARALVLDIPPTLLARADEVIE